MKPLEELEKIIKQSNPSTALTLINQALNDEKYYRPDVLVLRAKLYRKMDKHKESLQDLNEAVAQNDLHADAYFERAITYYYLKQYRQSLEDLDRAVELQPQSAFRYAGRAYLKAAMGMVHEAIEDYQKAIELDPDDAISHNNLGLIYENMGRRNQAYHLYRIAENLSGNIVLGELSDKNFSGVGSTFRQTIWHYVFSLFYSRQARKEYWQFVRTIFSRRKK